MRNSDTFPQSQTAVLKYLNRLDSYGCNHPACQKYFFTFFIITDEAYILNFAAETFVIVDIIPVPSEQ